MAPSNEDSEIYNETVLRRKDKDELIELLQEKQAKLDELTETTENQAQELTKITREIDENVTTNWPWDRIRKKFREYKDVNEALDFLVKVTEEKSICSNNKCPIFPAQKDISREIHALEREYEGVYDPKTAQKRFKTDAMKLKNWEKRYWKIRYKENNLLDDIIQIGLPNRTQKDTLFEMQDRYHEQEVDLLDRATKGGHNVNVNLSLNETGNLRRKAQENMMTATEFQNTGIKHWLNEQQKRLETLQKDKKSKRKHRDEEE